MNAALELGQWERQRNGFVQLLGLRLESVEPGAVRMRLPCAPHVLNGAGMIHGGAIVSLCDAAFWAALASVYGTEQPTATAALSCSFLRPAVPPHDLLADAVVLKRGQRIVYGEVRVTSDGLFVAHATLSFVNTPLADTTQRGPRL